MKSPGVQRELQDDSSTDTGQTFPGCQSCLLINVLREDCVSKCHRASTSSALGARYKLLQSCCRFSLNFVKLFRRRRRSVTLSRSKLVKQLGKNVFEGGSISNVTGDLTTKERDKYLHTASEKPNEERGRCHYFFGVIWHIRGNVVPLPW